VQTGIELQGKNGTFPGLAIADFDSERKAVVASLVDRIFATYPSDDVAYARACLEANGGVDRLFLSYYQRGEDGTIPEAQVFRLEGPGAVLYFRGYPHVHAFINVAMDGDAPLSSGELLGDNPSWLDRRGVKKLFEAAMRMETGADLGFYPEGSVAGRLRPGPIRSGDIYTLESWQESVQVGQIHGSMFTDESFAQLATPNRTLDRAAMYTIASTGYGLGQLREKIGRVESPRSRGMLRDLAAAHVKAHGFL
jgi:hypothetical protein